MLHCFLLRSWRCEKLAVFLFCTFANENRKKLGKKLRYEHPKCYSAANALDFPIHCAKEFKQ